MQTRKAAAVLIGGAVVAAVAIVRHSLAVGIATVRPQRSGWLAVLELLSLYLSAVVLPAIALSNPLAKDAASKMARFGQLLWSLACATVFVDVVLATRAPVASAPIAVHALIIGVSAVFAAFIVRGSRRADIVGLLAYAALFIGFGATMS